MDIKAEILTWIREKRESTELGPREITPASDILGEGILDSLGILNLVNWIEERFALELSDNDFDMDNFRTIDTITSFIEERRGMAPRRDSPAAQR